MSFFTSEPHCCQVAHINLPLKTQYRLLLLLNILLLVCRVRPLITPLKHTLSFPTPSGVQMTRDSGVSSVQTIVDLLQHATARP